MRIVESFTFPDMSKEHTEYSLNEFIEILQTYNPPYLYVKHYETEEIIEIIKGIICTLGKDIDLIFDGSRFRTYSFYSE